MTSIISCGKELLRRIRLICAMRPEKDWELLQGAGESLGLVFEKLLYLLKVSFTL